MIRKLTDRIKGIVIYAKCYAEDCADKREIVKKSSIKNLDEIIITINTLYWADIMTAETRDKIKVKVDVAKETINKCL